MDGANAYGSSSSSNYGGTISKYYDKKEGKKEKEKEKEKEKSDSDEEESESEEEKEKKNS